MRIPWEKIIEAVMVAERTYGHGKGETKRQMVVDVINEVFDLPIIPERYEAIVIGLLVDGVVAAFNYAYGRVWPLKSGEDK